jgi:hypothetical protein
MKQSLLSAIIILVLLLACAPAQQAAAPADSLVEAPASDSTDNASASSAEEVYRFKHVTVDPAAGTVTCEATAIRAEYALEFLLCRIGTKEHESLLVTQAEAWQIHAGLLMLGLTPGKPGAYIGEGEHARYLPPRGPRLDIRLRWTDAAGQPHEIAATDWLKLGEGADQAARPENWVFVGSDIMPGGQYLADADGGIIAVANLPSAVIDVPFESAQPLEQRLYRMNADVLPPVGTKVEMVISPLEGAESNPHARAWLEINRNGEMTIDGEPIAMDELRNWANRWTRKHEDGMVVIRSSAMTPGVYMTMARLELKIGGVFEFDKRVSPIFVPLMPRTPGQMEIDLAEWDTRFAEPQEQLREPGERAEETLQQIRRERQELQRLDELWADYEAQLRKRLEAYRQSHPQSDPAEAASEGTPQ